MLDGVEPGRDLHRALASKVFRKPPEEISKPERSRAKGANFGYIYGISARGLSTRLQVPLGVAEAFLKGCDASYPGFVRWVKRTRQEAMEAGFTASLFGHRRHLAAALQTDDRAKREEALRQLVNHPIQSTASKYLLLAGCEIADALEEAGAETVIFSTVHDSLSLRGPNDEKEAALRLAKTILENQSYPWLKPGGDPRFPRVPTILAEVEAGENLRDLKPVEGI